MKDPQKEGWLYSVSALCVYLAIFASDSGLCKPRVYIQVESGEQDQGNPEPTPDV